MTNISRGLPSRADGGPLVKICGLRREQDVDAALNAGADLLGIVFAPSRRQVTVDTASVLVRTAHGAAPVVGVFVNTPIHDINAVVAETGISFAQLSGDENPADLAALTVPYIKALHTREGVTSLELLHIMNLYRAPSAILLDAWSPLGGGSGRTADWAVARELVCGSAAPVMLAGGLNPLNVAEALLLTHPVGVDVSSGVEQDGWKDASLIRSFVDAVRSARGSCPSLGQSIKRESQ
jgi:phosphoribosylanthranilate isomerase